jgi:hypothetical protein
MQVTISIYVLHMLKKRGHGIYVSHSVPYLNTTPLSAS